jgi:hypothetical protein
MKFTIKDPTNSAPRAKYFIKKKKNMSYPFREAKAPPRV